MDLGDVPGDTGTEGCGRVPGAGEEPTLTAGGGHLGCFLPGVGVPAPTPWDTAGTGHLLSPYYPPVGEGHLVHHKPPAELRSGRLLLTQDKTILGWLDPVQGRRLFTFSPEGLADLGLPNPEARGHLNRKLRTP